VRARGHRYGHHQAVVRRVHVDFPLRIALRVAGKAFRRRPPCALSTNREAFDQRSVEADVDLMPLTHADQIQIELSLEEDLDAVLAVERELVWNRDSAARSERKIVVRAVLLYQRRWNLERVLSRAERTIAHGKPTHDARG